MASKAGGTTSKVFVWIILILLIAGLAGFGIGGLGGTIRTIGSVGDTEITVEEYQRGLQQDVQRQSQRFGTPLTFQQALQIGVDQQTRARLVAVAALNEETRILGLSVGDAEVARQLQTVPQFMGPDGQFDRDGYEFALSQNGLTPSEFEEQLRRDAARELLQQAVAGGLAPADTYSETIYNYLAEMRSFRWAKLEDTLLVTPNGSPTPEALQSFYTDNPSLFETPELRKLSYAWLTPEMVLPTIEVDEAILRELYDERRETYVQPERRLVERLAFPTAEAAQTARDDIEKGTISFEDLVAERDLSLDDISLGDVSRDDLSSDAAEAVFALSEPGLAGPVDTSLGPVLYRINAVLNASETSFEDARADLLSETTLDRARRIIVDQIDPVDDLLAGGATLEDLGQETEMEFATLDYVAGSDADIAAYEEVRNEIDRITVGDFPEVRELGDGSIFAIRLDEIVAPTVPPLDDIRAEVETAWQEQETTRRLRELGLSLAEQMRSGTPMEALGLEPRSAIDLTRRGFVEDAPEGILPVAFGLETAGVDIAESDSGLVLVELLDIAAPDLTTEEAQSFLRQIRAQSAQSLAADVFELYGQDAQLRHGLSLNQAAINAVHQSIHN
ncbi:MAG: SurA N-terminal domain-containing protein [Pseudomonadota bacterium]